MELIGNIWIVVALAVIVAFVVATARELMRRPYDVDDLDPLSDAWVADED